MFLNKQEEGKSEMESSLHQPSVASFKTLPSTDDLKKSELVRFNATSKTFSWDFAPFFEQPCAAGFSYLIFHLCELQLIFFPT